MPLFRPNLISCLVFSGALAMVNSCGGGSGSGGTNPNQQGSQNSESSQNSNTKTPAPLLPEKGEHLSAGAATGNRIDSNAFSDPSGNIRQSKQTDFRTGNSFFEKAWVSAPSSTTVRDGVGPLFNVQACQSCHIKDGRGQAPSEGSSDFASLFFRTARTDISAKNREAMLAGTLVAIGDSTVGVQIQDRATSAVKPEAALSVTYKPKTVTFADGHTVVLRNPQWIIKGNYGEFDKDTIFSARMSPAPIGQGLLEAIRESDILAHADPDDKNGDGISGKPNRVFDFTTKTVALGRFGLKSGNPTVLQQTAGAFHGDMGLTSRIFPKTSCLPTQTDCLAQPNGNGDDSEQGDYGYEVRDDILDFVTFYVSNLSVPKRRNHDSQLVLRGKKRFHDLGCTSCHVPTYTTAKLADKPEQSEQTIHPYTDLLLHDMGADLADFDINNQPKSTELTEYRAQANEWRTAPLWGIGLAKVVNPNATFLHDGRARTPLEAVLWHGGEAQTAQKSVLKLDAAGRAELEAFLDSL